PQGASFQRNKPAAALFIENGSDLLVSLAGSARLRETNHVAKLCRQIPARESPSVRTSHCVTRLTHSFMDGPLGHKWYSSHSWVSRLRPQGGHSFPATRVPEMTVAAHSSAGATGPTPARCLVESAPYFAALVVSSWSTIAIA